MKYSFTIIPQTPIGEAFIKAIEELCQAAEKAGLVKLSVAEAKYTSLADFRKFAEPLGYSSKTIGITWGFLVRDSTLPADLGGEQHLGVLLVRHRQSGKKRDQYLYGHTLKHKKYVLEARNAGMWEVECESLKEAIHLLLSVPPKGFGLRTCTLLEAWAKEL